MSFETFSGFLLWESTTRDTIDFKKAYVDMAGGDVLAGLFLSQLVYWHLPDNEGRSKLRVFHGDRYWVAKGRDDWYNEIRLSPKQVDRVRKVLEDLGLIETALYRFNGAPMVHFRIKPYEFMDAWQAVVSQEGKTFFPFGGNPTLPSGKMDIAQAGNSLTESTAEMTAKWKQCLAELEMQFTRATFDEWLRGSELVSLSDGRAIVRVKDDYAVDWLTSRLIAPIRRTLASVTGQDREVVFVVGETA